MRSTTLSRGFTPGQIYPCFVFPDKRGDTASINYAWYVQVLWTLMQLLSLAEGGM